MARLQAELQPKEDEEEFYDSDDEEKESVEQDERSMPDSQVSNTQIIDTAPNFEPVNQEVHESSTKSGLQTRSVAVIPFGPISRFPFVPQGSNKHYPDVPDFYGDSTKWEAWQLHLDAKFRASAMLFPTEQSRIDYIRDRCKLTAFDVIKARCHPSRGNPYNTTHEILADLDNVYDDLSIFRFYVWQDGFGDTGPKHGQG